MSSNQSEIKLGVAACAFLLMATAAWSQPMGGGEGRSDRGGWKDHDGGMGRTFGHVERERVDQGVRDDRGSRDNQGVNRPSESQGVKQSGRVKGVNTHRPANQQPQSTQRNPGVRNNRVTPRPVGRTGFGNPRPIQNRREILATPKERSIIRAPRMGFDNKPFHGNIMRGAPVGRHMAPLHNTVILGRVHAYERSEVVRDHYYWHYDGGFRYCHYYDPWGYHWYGWYVGSDFFWTRYYFGRWWWYDPSFDRWCWWNDNAWWWQNPSGTVYVYTNNNYAPADSAASVPESEAPNGTEGAQHTEYWDAADHRVVKVLGQDAFLYSTTNPPEFDPVYLASGVSDVKFSRTTAGAPLQVMLTLDDGSFRLFNGYGDPFGGQ